MLNDTALTDWKASGSYLKSTVAKGHKVFVREMGDSSASPDKTLLLLHGFPESSFSYHLVVNGLMDYFDRIILFDFFGFGLSDKPQSGYSYSLLKQADVALEVWNCFGITGGHLLAHDMGDSVATELVAREVEGNLPDWFTEGFKSYTFTNGSVVLKFAELRITQKLLLTRHGWIISKITGRKIFYHQIKSAHGEAALKEEEVERLWQMNIHNEGKSVLHHTIKYLEDRKRYEEKRWLPAMSATQTPIHICWGDKDNVARIEIAQYLKSEICPSADFTIMKGAGHFCQLGSPELWVRSVTDYYKNLE